MISINNESVYQQLLRECRANLAKGAYKVGERFPSERELAHQFSISRATANKVIAGLIAEDLLEHRKGIGTFVAQTKGLHASLRAMEDFQNMALNIGVKAQTRVLEFARFKAEQTPPAVQSALNLEAKENVVYVQRLRLADEQPVILEQRWLRAALVPSLKKSDVAGSILQLLESQFEIHVASEQQEVTARNLNRDEANKLGTKIGGAALCFEGTLFDENENAIAYYITLYRGDRFEFQNIVRPQRAATTSSLTLR